MKSLLKAVITIAAVISINAIYAQTGTPRVTKNQIEQRHRINRGVTSGQIDKKEERRLRLQQAKIRHDKRVAKSDGVVTPQERAKLNREQRRANVNIYRKKHN